MIFDIQRFSTHDGPGIRTVVFFKGCSLRCAWCSNPESQSFVPELLHNPQHCIGCHACLDLAFGGQLRLIEGELRVDRSKGATAGPAGVCPSLSLRLAGTDPSLEELMAEIRKDKAFFDKSGGGLTLSGGEPLAQPELALALAKACLDEGIGVAIETCLAFGRGTLRPFLDLPITWLADLKQVDAAAFRKGTKGELGPALDNLRELAESGAKLSIRVPVIPGFNSDDASLAAIVEYAASLPRNGGSKRSLDFLPYHELALGKYAMLDREYPLPRGLVADRRTIERYAEYARSLGLEATIGG